MVTNEYVTCTECSGRGKIHRVKDRCKKCKATGVVEETKILEFYIPKGARSGDSVALSGESDQAPGKITGDVILTFTQAPHSTFLRKGDDLYTEISISLVDALCGFSRVVVKHLDGRGIRVTTPRGKVIRPNHCFMIKHEGMPVKGQEKRGDMYIKINIEFPPDGWCVEASEIKLIQQVLPGQRLRPEIEVSKSDIDDVDVSLRSIGQLPRYPDEEDSFGDRHYGSNYGSFYGGHSSDGAASPTSSEGGRQPGCAMQ